MKSKEKTIILTTAIIVALLIVGNKVLENFKTKESQPDLLENKTSTIKEKDFVENEVIVTYDNSISDEEIESFLSTHADVKNYNILYDKTYVLQLYYNFNSRNEIQQKCNDFSINNTSKITCEANNIITLDDCTKGPC